MRVETENHGDLLLIPNPAEIPVKEVLEYLTDISESQDGTEERIQKRVFPRKIYSYRCPVDSKRWADAFISLYKALRLPAAVPVWSQMQYVGRIAAGATSIVCNTTNYEFRNDGLALLVDGCGGTQIVEITTVVGGSISCAALTLMRRAYLVPISVGKILGDVDYQTDGHKSYLALSYLVQETTEVAATPAQYLSRDYYTTEGLLRGETTERTISKREIVLDPGIGDVDSHTPWINTRLEVAHRSILSNAAEAMQFREFLARRLGRYRDFWLPSFESNIRVKSTGALTTTLNVWADSLFVWGGHRVNIAFQLRNGTWLNRIISAFADIDETTVQLTLNTSIATNADQIARVCFLGVYRLNTDRIEFDWFAAEACQVEIPFLELAP